MNNLARRASFVVLLVAFAAAAESSALAQQYEPPTIGQFFSNLNPANWRMPKMPTFRSLMPNNDERTAIRKKKDGLFGEVGKTASNTWNRTREALSPQKLNPVRFMPASARKPSDVARQQQKPGVLGSLFAPPPEPEKPQSVPDWMNQPRP